MSHINEYLGSFQRIVSKKKALHHNIRIAYQSYESPVNFFRKWEMDKVDSTGPVLVDTEKTDQQISDRTFEIYEFLEEGGKKIKENASFKISNMLLLTNDDMSLLISNFYMTLAEYCEMYIEEVESKKEAEENYPLPTNIFNIVEFLETDNYMKFQL